VGILAPLKLAVEDVPSASYLTIIWKHLTEAICNEVFATTRRKGPNGERQRKWTLFALLWFWIGLVHSQYTSQTRAILQARKGKSRLFPHVDATPESFFEKVQGMRPAFFQNLFLAFTEKLRSTASAIFENDLEISKKAFPDVFALDGSRLAKVARMLKIARDVTSAIIPGSMEAVYDLRRGILHALHFDPDGCVSEMTLLAAVVQWIPKGALLLADRFYAKPAIWRELNDLGIFMLTRYNMTVKKHRVAIIQSFRSSRLNFDDFLVDMGAKSPVRLRWVRIWGRGFEYILLTNVLDPKLLTPQQMLVAYRRRWSIERMFLAIKDVLNLNHLFNCSPGAVAQQVYATAIVYNALRVSQGEIAAAAGIAPEALSPDKLFPILIEQYVQATVVVAYKEWDEKGKRVKSLPPSLSDVPVAMPLFEIHVRDVLLEKRSEHRRRRRYCKGRRRATSYKHAPGGKKLLNRLT
jgi:Transposase DDE domain